MILSESRSKTTPRKWFAWALLLLSLAGIAWHFAPRWRQAGPEGIILCDAETRRGDLFYHNGHTFGKGELQSSERAFSGKYSCRVPAGDGLQFGFGYELRQFRAGEWYEATAWRYGPLQAGGSLVVQGHGGAAFYRSTDYPLEASPAGWQRLQLSFFVPDDPELDYLHIYVYSDGKMPVYFDDLSIRRLEVPETAFQPAALELRIDEEGLARLEQKREEALRTGILETGDDDWVNARLRVPEQIEPLEVKVRLKGDWLDHLRDDKWSFRVRVRGGSAWRGMHTFSLHTPEARDWLSEWLLHELWKREDVLTTRYDFIGLRLNGRDLGVYAYEEHFEKQLVEHQQRREGPILRFQENGMWDAVKRQLQLNGYLQYKVDQPARRPENAAIEAFGESDLLKSEVLTQQFRQARNLAQQLLDGSRPPAEVFDLDRLAKYFAICDALGGYHGIVWHNQRFYYNPVTNLLEPIGFDGFGFEPGERYTFLGQGLSNPDKLDPGKLYSALFFDRAFLEKYLQYVYRFSSKDYLADFFASVQAGKEARLRYLRTEFADYQCSEQDFLEEAQYVQALLLPQGPYSLLAFRSTGGQIELINAHTIPLEVLGTSFQEDAKPELLPEPVILPAAAPREYLLRQYKHPLHMFPDTQQMRSLSEYVLAQQVPPPGRILPAVPGARYVHYRVPGIDSAFVAPISVWQNDRIDSPRQSLFSQATLNRFPFLKISEGLIYIPAGRHQVDSDLVIPADMEVRLEAGAQLDLRRGARFISRSPVFAYGTEEAPVKIFSGDRSGSVAVLQTDRESILSGVIFDNLTNFNERGWMVTGAVTFYEADVRFNRCRFQNNHCEDGLNVVRSQIELEFCTIANTPFDGLDSDFCRGEIRHCRFEATGNDGLDFSGSVVNVKDCHIVGSRDKGISVGEQSDIMLFDCRIEGVPIAMASKDRSMLMVYSVALQDCEQGFTAYQKKPEYGGGHIVVRSYSAERVERLYNISPGSSLQIDGRLVE